LGEVLPPIATSAASSAPVEWRRFCYNDLVALALPSSSAGSLQVTDTVCLIDAFSPLALHQPATVHEVGELVRQAATEGQAIYPVGGRTTLHLGVPPTRPGIALATGRLTQIIDYPAHDMTITVQAGCTIAQLQTILAGEKQRLPIDVPHADRATVGGILATNTSGPRRYGCGTLRDYVIGISVVNDEGHEVKAGGRVVKNVAGYDMCKLYVGSLGTLGIITQVTFKLRPLPSEHALFAFLCPPDELSPALTQLHGTATRPVCIELLSPAATQALAPRLPFTHGQGWTIVVGFEDNADALQWQVQQLIKELGGRYDISGAIGACADGLWQALVAVAPTADGELWFKAGVLASTVAEFCVHAEQLAPQVQLFVHAGNGIVIGHVPGDLTRQQAVALVQGLRDRAAKARGYVVVTSCRPQWKDAIFVWGPPRGDWPVMRAVKEKLDPRRLFNPGRFVDSGP
jgi:glycolate oxidase FAD binding subunit